MDEQNKQKSSMPLIIGILVIVVLIAGGVYAFTGGGYDKTMMESGDSMYSDTEMKEDAMEKDGKSASGGMEEGDAMEEGGDAMKKDGDAMTE